jgi:integrase
MVRGFAAWLITVDPRREVPAFGLIPARRRRPKPHIFSKQETTRLMAEAARLTESKGPRAFTYVTLIGLLSATGLRPAEANALDRADVDLENGVLSIRQTKFGKSRFVPLSESTRAALVLYAKSATRSGHSVPAKRFLYRRGANDWLEVRYVARSPESHATSVCGRHLRKGVVAAASRLSPQLCNTTADRMVPRWLRCRPGTAQTRHISRACRCQPHILVHRSSSRAFGTGN